MPVRWVGTMQHCQASCNYHKLPAPTIKADLIIHLHIPACAGDDVIGSAKRGQGWGPGSVPALYARHGLQASTRQ